MKTRRFRNFLLGLVGVLVIALGLSIFTATTAAPSLSYTVTDLDTLGGNESRAYGINYAGQVVGAARTSGGHFHAFLWDKGTLKDLGTLNGYTNSFASDINNIGQVVGVGQSFSSTGSIHAFLWDKDTIKDLGTLGGSFSEAIDINNRGQVVGVSSITGYSNTLDFRAFLWDKGTMRNLNNPGDNTLSLAAAINDRGQVVGQAGDFCAFLWEKGTRKCLGGGTTTDINNKGQAVGGGGSFSSGGGEAFLWINGTRKELGTLRDKNNQKFDSFAHGINHRGQVVGSTYYPGYSFRRPYHAVMWVNEKIKDLNDLIPANSGWELIEARDINNKGQIVGEGKHNGQTRAFLLTPTWVNN
jgi:probable HAF family extracellular repeat protein